MPAALTKRQTALMKEIEGLCKEFNGEAPVFPVHMAFKLKVSEGNILTDLLALEAAKRIRRVGKPQIVKGEQEKDDAICIRVAPVISGAERMRRFREAQKKMGRKKSELWVTPEEEKAIRRFLENFRKAEDPESGV